MPISAHVASPLRLRGDVFGRERMQTITRGDAAGRVLQRVKEKRANYGEVR